MGRDSLKLFEYTSVWCQTRLYYRTTKGNVKLEQLPGPAQETYLRI